MRRLLATAPLLPGLAWVVVFFVCPMVITLIYSFSKSDGAGGAIFSFSVESYRRYALSPLFRQATWNSLKLASEVTVITLGLSYPVAYYIAVYSGGLRNVMFTFLLVPWWVSILVKNFAWMAILNDTGLANRVLMELGFTDSPVRLVYTEFAVVLGLVHVLVPMMVFPIYAAIERINPQLVEAARNLGANPLQTLLAVTFPLSLPGVAGGCVLTFILAFGSYVTPVLLGSPRNQMVANVIADQFLSALNWPLGAAISIVVLISMLVLLATFNRLIGLDRLFKDSQ
jgi:spermidine/putrescine transport system permease protein